MVWECPLYCALTPILLRIVGSQRTTTIHVKREKKVAKFWIDPVVLERTGGFSRVEVNKILKLVEEHREHLLEKWYEFFGR